MKALHKLPQISNVKHSLYKLLNKPGSRSILAASAAIMATVRVGGICKVSYDGEWVHRFPSTTLIEPRLTLWIPAEIEGRTLDLYLHQYRPSEGDTVIDVGAGTGWETLFLSRHTGKSGRVISIEAHPTTFRCLAKMCEKNHLENVTLIHAAIGDQDQEVRLSDFDEHVTNRVTEADSGVRVNGTTLDHIFRYHGLTQVDYLKMNIEGAERPALSGMTEMIQKTRNVCISCHDFLADEGGPDELRTKSKVVSFLKQNGFAVSLRESDLREDVRDVVYGLNEKLPSNRRPAISH